jgi:hypothetical protein
MYSRWLYEEKSRTRDGFPYAHRADFAEAVLGEEAIGWP